MQVWASSLYELGEKHNMTQFEYATAVPATDGSKMEIRRRYLLDINPNHVERTRGNWMNVIDARWIDIKTGLFIDITGLSEVHEGTGRWECKNQHSYTKEDLLPLTESSFEGVKALVPKNANKILRQEYRDKALRLRRYEGHVWNDQLKLWVKDPAA